MFYGYTHLVGSQWTLLHMHGRHYESLTSC